MSKLHIITISDGNLISLKKTLKSINKQNYKNFKNIIISKTNLAKIKKKYKKNRIFIFKKDYSIYEAMNHGLKKSVNKNIIFLNSGDTFSSNSSLKLICYNLKKRSCVMFVSILKNDKDYFIPKKKLFFSKNFLSHSSFIRPSIKFDNGFKVNKFVTADGEWMKKHVLKFGVKKIFKSTTIFYLGGISNYPSIRSLKMKLNSGPILLIKEIVKYFLLKFVGKNNFYKIIYFFKYDRVNYDQLKKLLIKNKNLLNGTKKI